jgi:glycine cleavage system H protein
MDNIPSDLKYTKSHEWVRFSDGKAVIGITDHAQQELTDIVFVELPEEGKTLEKGEVALVVESVKIAADIYAPLSGTVLRVNRDLESEPGHINQDPYGKGWIVEIQTEDTGEELLDAAAYGSLIGQ